MEELDSLRSKRFRWVFVRFSLFDRADIGTRAKETFLPPLFLSNTNPCAFKQRKTPVLGEQGAYSFELLKFHDIP